jgi:hypothetical protein
MKLEPWQAELLVKIEEGARTISIPRQSGKSDWYALFRKFVNKPSSRFVPYDLHHKHGLMIQDYMWWHANEREILNWMEANLPNGIEHQQGMTVTFDTDQQRMLFLLRWA